MISASEKLLSILLSYPLLIGSLTAVIVSTIFLIAKGKRCSKSGRRWMIGLLITAGLLTVFSLGVAFSFGNPHPSASPVPLP
ncbi:MAG TPA: hypothetical protein VHO48_01695 [Anaerolineaceae bacterium]|nr:hypothetical protein [Anaerolineaceae bacterium]